MAEVVEIEEGAADAAEQEVAGLPESHSRPRCCRRRRLWERERVLFLLFAGCDAGLGFKWAIGLRILLARGNIARPIRTDVHQVKRKPAKERQRWKWSSQNKTKQKAKWKRDSLL